MLGKKILVVDDLSYVRDLIKIILKKYEVNEAEDGDQAYKTLKAENHDLVITDCSMPVMDGFELMRKIRRDEELKHIPIIALSGTPNNILEARNSGANDYIDKPFNFDDFLKKVDAALKN